MLSPNGTHDPGRDLIMKKNYEMLNIQTGSGDSNNELICRAAWSHYKNQPKCLDFTPVDCTFHVAFIIIEHCNVDKMHGRYVDK
eukprot:9106573-Prorocentrum_lima.AAC.1